jgi:hypothetical protein
MSRGSLLGTAASKKKRSATLCGVAPLRRREIKVSSEDLSETFSSEAYLKRNAT